MSSYGGARALAAVVMVLLAACGGGTGGASAPVPAPGPLVLAMSGEQQVGVGTSLVNQAVSPNARSVSYASSDTRVATVNASGRVDTLARGTVTITATESGTNPQSVSYTVRVLPAVLKGSLVDETSLRSAHTGIDYPYTVYLPAGYAASGKRYPVMYMTDGQWNTNLYKMADQKNKELILVMIYQGPEHRRMVDYLPPGTSAYMRFLKTEMVPLIESSYRTNGERSFYGVSAGGTIGAVLLANEPVGEPYFKRYILGDGAFWALTPDVLQQESARFTASAALKVSLFVTGTRQGNLVHVQALSERYQSRAYTGMTIRQSEYAVTHDEMSDPTFIEAMDTYF